MSQVQAFLLVEAQQVQKGMGAEVVLIGPQWLCVSEVPTGMCILSCEQTLVEQALPGLVCAY